MRDLDRFATHTREMRATKVDNARHEDEETFLRRFGQMMALFEIAKRL